MERICFGGSSADTHCHFRYPPWSSHDRSPWMFQSKHCWISVSHLFIVLSAGPPPFGSSWVKRYCTFVKEQKILHMMTFDHRSGGKNVSCARRSRTLTPALLTQRGALICVHTSDSPRRIFCFRRARPNPSHWNHASVKPQMCWTGGSAWNSI